ncbi:MAG: LysR family transcriptional regulator [Woeseia sp.]
MPNARKTCAKLKDNIQNVENIVRFDSIRDLQLFARIYEQGSISAAAAIVGVTPAVASKRLKRLEREVGETLFHRSTRNISPTGMGSVFYKHAMSILALAENAEAEWTGGGEPAGHLRVTASVGFGRMHLGTILSDFVKRYEQIRLDAVFTDRMLDMVEDSVDLAIRICLPMAHPNLIMRRLCSGERLLCASPRYLETHGYPAAPRDLKRHNCVVLGNYDIWKLENATKTESVRVAGNYHSNDGEAVLDAIRNDVGIGVVALWHAGRDIRAGKLLPVLGEFALSPQPEVFAVYHPAQRHVPRIHALIEFIEDKLKVPSDSINA